MSYELNTSDILAFAESQGAQTHRKGDELVFRTCPYCGGGRHGDRDTFSIHMGKGVFNCLRASCGKQGHFVELCRDFNFPLTKAGKNGAVRSYRRLPQMREAPQMRQSSLEYLAGRGISRETAERYSLTARKDNPDILCFPFFNLEGRLVSIKYRNMRFRKGRDRNKEWFEKDTEPILFGLQRWNGKFDRAVITEGQLDSLSLSEAGVENAFSVPNGCSGFTWLNGLEEWLNKFKSLVVFGDMEDGRMTLLDPLLHRLSVPIRGVRTEDYLQEKDANDILRKYGPGALRTAVERAAAPRVKHVREVADADTDPLDMKEKIQTGFPEIDNVIGGLGMGQLVLLSGERGHGKSTFLSQIIANALDQKDPQGNRYPIFVYSGEMQDNIFRAWLDFQLAGVRHIDTVTNKNGKEVPRLDKALRVRMGNWYRGRLWTYDDSILGPGEEAGLELLMQTVEDVIRQYGCRLIAMDNMMTALESIDTQEDLNKAQTRFVARLKAIAVKYNVCVLLVAHPRKSPAGMRAARTLISDDICGSGNVTNKADVVMTCQRHPEKECCCQIQILKNRVFGKTRIGEEAIELNYSPISRRMFESGSGNIRYGWEREEEPEEKLPRAETDAMGLLPLAGTELPF